MSAPSSPPHSGRCPGLSPMVRRDGRWRLVTASGSVLVTDPAFADTLDGFATAMAAADQAVAVLRIRQNEPAASGTDGRR
ncbi:hypothetical protein PV682_34205 [Streptomyces niveiscabiei]|uniref:hypothetical protein n=1 Tax=Streptomyces niveiscabiei TaxID=164115 RepID=UPI0029A1421C|nr:hypothetical protein [Streptomyces niveiscabiei]MDX3386468.1 hypothetical protein [Streptomyces niveiscabiei]